MTQEQFEQMRQCSEHIKVMERVKECIKKYSFMGMHYAISDQSDDRAKAVIEMYNALIPEDERKKLTEEYRAKMIALIDEDIKCSKEEFEKI